MTTETERGWTYLEDAHRRLRELERDLNAASRAGETVDPTSVLMALDGITPDVELAREVLDPEYGAEMSRRRRESRRRRRR